MCEGQGRLSYQRGKARVGEKAAKQEVVVFFKRHSQEEKQYRYWSILTVTVITTLILDNYFNTRKEK